MHSLHNLLPSFWTDIYEIDEILKAEQYETDTLYQARFKLLDNLFLSTADSDAVARYEKIYGVLKGAEQSLEERRYVLETLMKDKRPMTLQFLTEFLTGICGEDGFEITLNEYTLSINLTLPNENVERAVIGFIKKAIPANIVLETDVDYNVSLNIQ